MISSLVSVVASEFGTFPSPFHCAFLVAHFYQAPRPLVPGNLPLASTFKFLVFVKSGLELPSMESISSKQLCPNRQLHSRQFLIQNFDLPLLCLFQLIIFVPKVFEFLFCRQFHFFRRFTPSTSYHCYWRLFFFIGLFLCFCLKFGQLFHIVTTALFFALVTWSRSSSDFIFAL